MDCKCIEIAACAIAKLRREWKECELNRERGLKIRELNVNVALA